MLQIRLSLAWDDSLTPLSHTVCKAHFPNQIAILSSKKNNLKSGTLTTEDMTTIALEVFC